MFIVYYHKNWLFSIVVSPRKWLWNSTAENNKRIIKTKQIFKKNDVIFHIIDFW